MSFLIRSNIFVSLCAASLAWQIYLLRNIETNYLIVALVFFSTLFVYNFHRYIKSRSIKEEAYAEGFVKNSHLNQSMAVLSIVFILWIFIYLSSFERLLFGVVGLFTILYSVNFLKIKGRLVNFRKIPFVKLFWVALMWSVMTVSFPLISDGVGGNYYLLFFERFVFIMAITIPFDIRDMEADESEGLVTVPIYIGFKRSRQLSMALIVLFGITCIYGGMIGMHDWIQVFALILSSGAALFLLSAIDKKKKSIYYTLGVEGLSLVQSILVALFMLSDSL